jgi:hypothetical protein
MPVVFRFDKSCDTVFPHPLHSRSDWNEIEDTVNWLSSFEEWGNFCAALEIPPNELTDAMSCAGYRVPTKVGLTKYSWHEQFLSDYRKCSTIEMQKKYPIDVSNYIRRHNVPRKWPKQSSPVIPPVSTEPSTESKLDDAFDRLLSGIQPQFFTEFYTAVNRVVMAKLRPSATPYVSAQWLLPLLRSHDIYDIMAALMRAIKRHE